MLADCFLFSAKSSKTLRFLYSTLNIFLETTTPQCRNHATRRIGLTLSWVPRKLHGNRETTARTQYYVWYLGNHTATSHWSCGVTKMDLRCFRYSTAALHWPNGCCMISRHLTANTRPPHDHRTRWLCDSTNIWRPYSAFVAALRHPYGGRTVSLWSPHLIGSQDSYDFHAVRAVNVRKNNYRNPQDHTSFKNHICKP